jgi:hypothetical protein
MEEDCIASHGPQRTVALEKKKKKTRNLNTSNTKGSSICNEVNQQNVEHLMQKYCTKRFLKSLWKLGPFFISHKYLGMYYRLMSFY